MTVLCHDTLGGIGIHLGTVRVLAGVVGIAVQEQNAVCVLLDGTGVAQVRKLRAMALTPATPLDASSNGFERINLAKLSAPR